MELCVHQYVQCPLPHPFTAFTSSCALSIHCAAYAEEHLEREHNTKNPWASHKPATHWKHTCAVTIASRPRISNLYKKSKQQQTPQLRDCQPGAVLTWVLEQRGQGELGAVAQQVPVWREASSALRRKARKPIFMPHGAPVGRGSFTPLMRVMKDTWAALWFSAQQSGFPVLHRCTLLEVICSKESNLCWPNQRLCSFQLSSESGFAGNTPLSGSLQGSSVIPRARELKTELSSPWFSLLLLLCILCHRRQQVDLPFHILLDIKAGDALEET